MERSKTKTKAITLANHRRRRQLSEPIRIWSNYMQPVQSAGNARVQLAIGFGFVSHWLRKWRELWKNLQIWNLLRLASEKVKTKEWIQNIWVCKSNSGSDPKWTIVTVRAYEGEFYFGLEVVCISLAVKWFTSQLGILSVFSFPVCLELLVFIWK